jgi:hypothetical protein
MDYSEFKDSVVLVQLREPHLWLGVGEIDGVPSIATQRTKNKEGEEVTIPMRSPFILGKLTGCNDESVTVFYREPGGQGLEVVLLQELIFCMTRVVERRILDPNDTVG